MTQGQKDYEAEVAAHPLYHDGTPRKTWAQLDHIAQWSWERGAARTYLFDRGDDVPCRSEDDAP